MKAKNAAAGIWIAVLIVLVAMGMRGMLLANAGTRPAHREATSSASHPSTEMSPESVMGMPARGLAIGITMDHYENVLGSELEVYVVTTNVTNTALTIRETVDTGYRVAVFNEKGQSVPLSAREMRDRQAMERGWLDGSVLTTKIGSFSLLQMKLQ
jgi:hypothetical protein